MKIKILLFFSVLLLSSSFSVQKASAQWVVNDPAHMEPWRMGSECSAMG